LEMYYGEALFYVLDDISQRCWNNISQTNYSGNRQANAMGLDHWEVGIHVHWRTVLDVLNTVYQNWSGN
jgi:hypothetical protein